MTLPFSAVGSGGYPAAIRAAQLGASVAASSRKPSSAAPACASAASRPRPGCRPPCAQGGQRDLRQARRQGRPARARLRAAQQWKDGVVEQLTGGVATLFKANGVEWVKGVGRFKDANTIAVEGGEDVTFKSAIIATGSSPLRPPIEGIDSERCVDSTGLLAQTEVPRRSSSSAAASSAASSPPSLASASAAR